MNKKCMVLALVTLNLVGCASVPMGDAKDDTALKTFARKPDVAGVYIYRNEFIGGAVRMDLEMDGKPLGQTIPKTYVYTEVSAGKHTVTSKSENTDTLEFDAVPGKLYYIWQEVKLGILFARTKLHLVDEPAGKQGVLESKLAVASK